MSEFNGKRFCGNKIKSINSKKPWVTTNDENRFSTCPKGQKSCPDNLCIRANDLCPITDIKLVKKDEILDSTFETVEFDNETLVAFSRGESRPITSVKMEIS